MGPRFSPVYGAVGGRGRWDSLCRLRPALLCSFGTIRESWGGRRSCTAFTLPACAGSSRASALPAPRFSSPVAGIIASLSVSKCLSRQADRLLASLPRSLPERSDAWLAPPRMLSQLHSLPVASSAWTCSGARRARRKSASPPLPLAAGNKGRRGWGSLGPEGKQAGQERGRKFIFVAGCRRGSLPPPDGGAFDPRD